MKELIDVLVQTKTLSKDQFLKLLTSSSHDDDAYLMEQAQGIAKANFGNKIYIRGLIEISNFCVRDCFYCGIRRSNDKVARYRLSYADILAACKEGYHLGFRTFVLQGGEDPYYTQEKMVEIIASIRKLYPDCAITLSDGEHDRSRYQAYFDAGANRFLLRHESINPKLYAHLHPSAMHIDTRVECLKTCKEIGFQVGSGIMVGTPKQSFENIVEDIYFLQKLQPEMIGIGPFLSSKDTPFKDEKNGSSELTLRILAILRIMHPHALIPSTTALASSRDDGRELGILAGANVVMPNLSPPQHRKDYALYDNKLSSGSEAAQSLDLLERRLQNIGYEISYARGDFHPQEGE